MSKSHSNMTTESEKNLLSNIGSSIKIQRLAEVKNHANNPAIGRVSCYVESSENNMLAGENVFWLVNHENQSFSYRSYCEVGRPVFKNTKMGEILSKYKDGKHDFTLLTKTKRPNKIDVQIHNRAVYAVFGNSVKEITVNIDGDRNTYYFQYLEELIKYHEDLNNLLAEKKRLEEENKIALEQARKAKEEALKRKAEEEAERLRLEELRRQEEERKNKEEIERLEKQINESEERIRYTQSFIRQGSSLRSQHILDEFQESAKRSHLFDGIPIVIEGGPGTGKTTTMIQRLKFLISSESLNDYDTPLSKEQINFITNPDTRNQNWLFFSPTIKLLGFLRQNMIEEDLRVNENNTTILDTFCNNMLRAYKLRMPNSDGPFKIYRQTDGEETLVLDAPKLISAFEDFVVKSISNILIRLSTITTVDFPWHNLAVEIKAYCSQASKVKDLTGLMNLLNSMQLNEKSKVSGQEKELKRIKDHIALLVKNSIIDDEDISNKVLNLFEEWAEEDNVLEDNLNSDELDQSEDYEDDNYVELDFEPMLFKNIKPILRNLSLKRFDSRVKLTSRQTALYNLICKYIEEHDLSELGHLEWFKKNFAFPCRGIESNIFNQIPKLYKEFRKEQIKQDSPLYKQSLLFSIQKKDGGKQIHREELELIVGFINNMVYGVYKKSKNRFAEMRNNKYVKAYMENVKPVIGIDEATDYSMIDYYFITSFRHYEFSSISLCGDIMQGLNKNGVQDWNALKKHFLPNLEVYELKESYRQLPTLLDMSKQLYKDERGYTAPYSTIREKNENEPAPLCYISDSISAKTQWIARRIVEIYKYYGECIPSIAILVGNEVNIEEMIDTMVEQDILNGIDIFDCSSNRSSDTTKCVRIFRLEDVKGMEFEVVFFYDIDQALVGHSHNMMRRYLYVGVSRATSHLAALFSKEEGNEDIIKYFDRTKKNWKM